MLTNNQKRAVVNENVCLCASQETNPTEDEFFFYGTVLEDTGIVNVLNLWNLVVIKL